MNNFEEFALSYFDKLENQMRLVSLRDVELLGQGLLRAWENNNQVFVFGNGGSAGNAIHLANDFLYGVGKGVLPGLKIHALPSNSAVLTCLANDEGYNSIFVEQLKAFQTPETLSYRLVGAGTPKYYRALRWSNGNKINIRDIGFRWRKSKENSKTRNSH